MAFAGGMCVFPGGGVDPRDYDASWSPRARAGSPAEWACAWAATSRWPARWCVPRCGRPSRSPACCSPAPSDDSVVSDTTGDDWEADRVALESRELSLTDFLVRRGLVLRTDLLGAWSGWLTPVFEPRRYETWFFVAVLPEGQVTRDVSSESSSVHWTPAPSAAVEQVEAGEILMLPPTYLDLPRRRAAPDPGDVLAEAADRAVDMFTPAGGLVGRRLRALDARALPAPGGPAMTDSDRRAGPARSAPHLRAGAQRRRDDPRRHQHVGARVPDRRARWSSTPARRSSAPRRGRRGRRRRRRWCC